MRLAGLLADIPSLITVALRLIQQIGLCHGYDVRADEEQEYVMHVLRIGSTASRQAKVESLLALRPVEQVFLKVSWRKISEIIARREFRHLSLRGAMQEFARMLGIQLTRRKVLQLAPVVGALSNAQFVNDVGRAAYMLYRRRRIAQMEGPRIVDCGIYRLNSIANPQSTIRNPSAMVYAPPACVCPMFRVLTP